METITTSSSSRVFLERSPGVELSVLRRHDDGGLTFLIRMEKGARAERHGHPGGEETYLLAGRLRIDRRVDAAGASLPDVILGEGDHAFVPANEHHEGLAEEAATFLVVAPGGITRPCIELR